MLEHGAYTLLIDACYDRERFPTKQEAIEWCWARSPAEIEAVEFVLSRFFDLDGDVYVQQRIRDEVEAYHENAATNKRIATEREQKRRERARSVNDAPPYKHEAPPNQEPRTTNQEPYKEEPTALVPEPLAQAPERVPPCPTQELVDLYHQHLPMLPRVEVMNDGRRRALSARWREVVTDKEICKTESPKDAALDFFGWYFGHASKSPFLTGRSKNWRADFDFLITPSKFVKVVEGHYHKEAT